MNEVYMDIPAVRGIAKNFGTIGQLLMNVARTLEALSRVLHTTAFVGAVGGAALAQYIDLVRPHVDMTSQKCTELSQDLEASVTAFERGDEQGATKFY